MGPASTLTPGATKASLIALKSNSHLIIATDNDVDHAFESHPLEELNGAFATVGCANCNLDVPLLQPGVLMMMNMKMTMKMKMMMLMILIIIILLQGMLVVMMVTWQREL